MQTPGLHAKEKRYPFGLPELEYLSHSVSKDGLKADPAKFKAIQECPQAINLRYLQYFLGKANYYSKFVPFFAEIAAPLHKLLYKIVNWI